MEELKRVSTTAIRLQEAMNSTNKKQIDLVKETGLNKSTISRYIAGTCEPKQDAIYKLAKTLNVTEMWLWGYNVSKERSDTQKKNDQLVELITLLRTDNELLDLAQKLSKLTPEQRQSIKPILSAFTQQQLMD